MNLMKTAGLIAAAFGLVAVMSGEARAQAPTLTATLTGARLDIAWTGIPGVTGYIVSAGTAPGSSNIASVPVPATTLSVAINPVPVGTYYLRVRAALGTIIGPNSNEVTVTVGAAPPPPPPGPCVPPSAPTATATVAGGAVTVTWDAVAGATGYQVVWSRFPGGSELIENATGLSMLKSIGIPGTYYVRVVANNACGGASSLEVAFTIAPGAPGPRTPNPAPGTILPPPNYGESVVRQAAALYRGDLINSCREHGGNNIFMFRVVQMLRQRDSRWGLNYKRGNRGDLSQDIVTYNPTDGPDEGATFIYLWDMIGGHCGDRPDWNWADVTQATRDAGRRGECGNRDCSIWTLEPYLRSGFPAVEGQQ